MTDILPTHHCFDDAIEFIEQEVRRDRSCIGRMMLVHAICVAQNGHRYTHAWVEELGDLPATPTRVWDAGLIKGQRVYFAVEREDYYAARRVERTVAYSIPEMLIENAASEHYGPWDPEIYALARPGDAASFGTFGSIPATYEPEGE